MKRYLLVLLSLLVINLLGHSQINPVQPALSFNQFIQNNATLVTNETEGPVAIGGDLTIGGNYQVAIHSVGTFQVSGVSIGLLIGGKVNYSSGGGSILYVNNSGYVKIGDCTGSTIWYKDNNNANSNLQVTSGSYNGTPRIQLQTSGANLGTSASVNPVCQGGLIDFSTAFSSLKSNATCISGLSNNASLTNPNGNSISNVGLPNQVKINLASGVNILNVTGSDLNNVSVFTYNNAPDANHILVINVNAEGSYSWNVWNQAGVGFSNCPYIIYNFYNTTTLNIIGNNTIEGTVLAPYADITKTTNQANIEGQVIAQSFVHSGGEVHYAIFNATITCSSCTKPDAGSDKSACISGSTIMSATGTGTWTAQSGNPGTATITTPTSPTTAISGFSTAGVYNFIWTNGNCSDTASVTVKSPTSSTTNLSICSSDLPYTWNSHSYSIAGTYLVHLTNAAGCDSAATLVLTVKTPSTSTTNVALCAGSFPYTWNGFIYNVAGTYTIHLTNAAGCDSAATLVLTSGSPSSIVVNQTAATCNSLNNPNYNGIITLSSATNALKFGISSLNADPYNGADYTHATAISSLPANVITNVPNTGGAYIVRVYGSDASCYTDVNVTTFEVLCSVSCANTVFPTGSSLAVVNWVIPPDNAVNMSNFYEPGSASPNGSFTIYAPGNLTIQNQNLSDYAAFCSDITKTLWIDQNYYDYRVVPLEYLAKENAGNIGTPGEQIPDGGIGPVRAGMLRYLVDKHFASTNSTDAGWSANNHGTAFQIAIWEITHDQYKSSPIDFTVKNATTDGVYFDYGSNSTTNKAILDSAELWVKDIQNKSWDWTAYTPTVWHAVAINSPSSQDLVLAEPISVCAVSCAKPSAGDDQSVCLDNTGTAHATLTGTSTASGTWTASGSNVLTAALSTTISGVATVTITAPGTYSFIYTVTGGCSDTMTVVANAPTSSVTTATICAGSSYLFNGTYYSTADTYTAHLTNAVGCDSAARLVLTVQTLNPIVGDTTICLDSTKVLTNATTGGIWSSSNPAILTVDNSGNITPVAAGVDTIYYTVAGCLAPASITITVSDCSGIVDGGSGGGLESKSLGNAVSQRFINRVTNSVSEQSDYTSLPNIANATQLQVMGNNSTVTLAGLLPGAASVSTVLGGAINVYSTSPTDLVNMTNALDVQAQDYTVNTSCKAVAFATSTNGVIYSHTKPICDRLREAQLQDIQNVTINNITFVQYKLLQVDGNTEYAISFSAGKNNNSNFYQIQSKWLTEDYTGQDQMYNFQIWGVNPQVVKSMVTDVLNKLNNSLPYYQLSYAPIPKTYIVSHTRNQKSLDVTINNNTSATSANLYVTDYMNELSTALPARLVPVTINAFGQTTVSVNMEDKYQADVKMDDATASVVNDEVYSNDGPWDISYNTATTSISNYSIANDGLTPATGEWRLFRNVTVNATTSDYVSVYKLMKAAGLPRDISAYNSFKFTANATGASAITITFVKNSITDWNKQYSVTIPAAHGIKDYSINYSDLVSAGLGNIDTKDITAVNIALLVSNAHTNLNATISNARFALSNSVIVPVVDTKMNIYPNPVVNSSFSCSFNALKAETLTMKVIEIGSGKVIHTQSVNAVVGSNTIAVQLNNSYLSANNYVVTLEGDSTKYTAQNIVINKR